MKTLSFIFLLFFLAKDNNTDNTQTETYLQIKTENTAVSYPPYTAFELYDNDDVLLYTQENLPRQYKISSMHRLVLHPSWKNTEETYRLENATLVLHDFDSELWIHSENNTDDDATSVKANKQLSKSAVFQGNYNLNLMFTNGLEFNYVDGNTEATLDNEPLKVEGNYIIESELGTYKISFNPENGETWWVFEPKNQ